MKKATATGDYFFEQLNNLKEIFPMIREVRGVGLMLAVELDRPGAIIVDECLKEGLLINCIQLKILRFLPPLIITKKEIDILVKTISKIFSKIQT